MSIAYEVMASTGSYTDKNGDEKRRWMKCGIVMTTKTGGLALKLEAIPIGSDGWFSLFEPKAKDEQPRQKKKSNIMDEEDTAPF